MVNIHGRPKGIKTSPEAIERVRQAKLEYYRNGGVHPMSGRRHSPETREKMRLRKLGTSVTEETKKKISKSFSGQNHWNWKEDRSLLIKRDRRNDSLYVRWRKDVKTRDGYKCQMTHTGECSGRIEVHHIRSWKDYPLLRYEITNGITLCHAHHPRKRAEEKRLETVFTDIVSVSRIKL